MKVEVAATLPTAPASLWHVLATSRQLTQWLAREAQFEARVGKPYRLVLSGTKPEEIVTGRVMAWVPEVRLSLSVSTSSYSAETVVTLFLASLGEGRTKLTIVHDGFKRFPTKERPAAMAKAEAFWQQTIDRLAAHLGVTVTEGHVAAVLA